MTEVQITPDVERAPWTDLAADQLLTGVWERVGLLRHGTTEGRASVAMVVRLPDGRPVIVETTWRLFWTTARALAASPVAAEEVADG